MVWWGVEDSRLAAGFVEWYKIQDWWEQTTIVISGDHCTMDVYFCRDVPYNAETEKHNAGIS